MNETAFADIGGVQLEYRWFLPPESSLRRPDIVMLHEGLGSLAMWKHFPQQLADAAGARVLAYSRPGYGASDEPPWERGVQQVHAHEATDVLPRLLEALAVKRPVLFGHSDGASVALLHAGLRPGDTAGAILLAPHVFVEDMCLASITATRQSYLETDLSARLSRYHRNPDTAFWLWCDMWLSSEFRSWNIENSLRSIVCPLLLIQGRQDEYGTMEQLERISLCAPHASVLKLDDCRHSPHRDQPSAVLGAVTTFMHFIA